jgi:hypothetical protein
MAAAYVALPDALENSDGRRAAPTNRYLLDGRP